MSAEGFKTSLRGVLNPLVGWLVALDVSPGAITAAGLCLSAVAGLMLAAGGFLAGGIALLLSGLCDVLDGMVARASGKGGRFGAVADSSADRYGESFVLGGLLYYYGAGAGSRGASGPALSTYPVFAALVGSYMVSYVRARAEGVGLECKVGLMERPERLAVLLAGALLGPTAMTVLLWPLALLANTTAIHRLLAVRGKERGERGRGTVARGGFDAGAAGGADAPRGAGAPGHAGEPRDEGGPAMQTVKNENGARIEGGLLVTLEGVEGCGKSTQAARLVEFLAGAGHMVVGTREPGGTQAGESIRRVLLESGDRAVGRETELLLYMADRAQHVRDVIRPALEAGAIVVCDRFSDATLAYQAGGRGVPESTVSDLNALAAGGLKPHLTILLDLPEDEGLARAAGRGTGFDRMEREDTSFHRDVRNAYLEIARREPERVRIVDAARSEDEVTRAVISLVGEAIEMRDRGPEVGPEAGTEASI